MPPTSFSDLLCKLFNLTSLLRVPIIEPDTPYCFGGEKMKQCMDSDNLHRRLKKIIGQVQAIDRMIDEDVPCEDVLSQINAAKSALHGCGKVVLEGHIKHCVRDGIEHGDADKTIESFTKAVERFSNMT
jgi:CsoR family transcriptional regulator, copper-sensing transcriptional repressor